MAIRSDVEVASMRLLPSFVVFGIAAVGLNPSYGQTRTELPIRAVPLSMGAVLYSVQIKVGTTQIEAGLDTGSTGLRVFPGTLVDGDVKSGSPIDPYSFSSGNRYDGRSASGTLALGTISGTAPLEMIEAITCVQDRPDCPATHISPSDYGVRGDSLTGGRFRAIFGINTGAAAIANPLLALSVKHWIVELPRPGETGKLILNPSEDETKDFTYIPNVTALRNRGAYKDAIAGCLIDAQTKEKGCGPMLLDSGAPNIRLVNVPVSAGVLADGRSVAFVFYDDKGPRVIENIVLGQAALGTRAILDDRKSNNLQVIAAGTAPYQGLDVLYEPDHDQIGLRPRSAITSIPTPQIIPR
jgi:hypothetical protein